MSRRRRRKKKKSASKGHDDHDVENTATSTNLIKVDPVIKVDFVGAEHFDQSSNPQKAAMLADHIKTHCKNDESISSIKDINFEQAKYNDYASLFPIFNENHIYLRKNYSNDSFYKLDSFDRLLLCFGILRQENTWPYDLAPIIHKYLGNLIQPFISCSVEYNNQYETGSQSQICCIFQINYTHYKYNNYNHNQIAVSANEEKKTDIDINIKTNIDNINTENRKRKQILLTLRLFNDGYQRHSNMVEFATNEKILMSIDKQNAHGYRYGYGYRYRYGYGSKQLGKPQKRGVNVVDVILVGLKKNNSDNTQKYFNLISKKLENKQSSNFCFNFEYFLKYGNIDCHCLKMIIKVARNSENLNKVHLIIDDCKKQIYSLKDNCSCKMISIYSKKAKENFVNQKSSDKNSTVLNQTTHRLCANFDIGYTYHHVFVCRVSGTTCHARVDAINIPYL